MQVNETVQVCLQLRRVHARQRNAVAVAEIDHGVARQVGGDERRQVLERLCVGEVVDLVRVVSVEIIDGVGADLGRR